MPNPTTRLGLTKPTIGDATVWGIQLNTDLDLIDAGAVILSPQADQIITGSFALWLQNPTLATSLVSQSSPPLNITGTYWTGSASAVDKWSIQDIVGNGANGTSTLTFVHAGTTGQASIAFQTYVGINKTNPAAYLDVLNLDPNNVDSIYWRLSGQISGILANSGGTSAGVMILKDGSNLNAIRLDAKANNTSWLNTGGNFGFGLTNPSQLLTMKSTGSLAWDNGSGTADVGLSRLSTGAVLGLGNGTPANFSGTLKLTILNAVTGIQINGVATSGNVLRGDGTNFVSAQLAYTDLSGTLAINPTNSIVPIRSSATSFIDSPLSTNANGTLQIIAPSIASADSNTGIYIIGNLTNTALVEIHNNYAVGIDNYAHSNTDFRAPTWGSYRSGGTQAAPTVVQGSWVLGHFGFSGWNGSSYAPGAFVQVITTEIWSGTATGSKFQFFTNITGTTTGVESLTVTGRTVGFDNVNPKFVIHTSSAAVALGAPNSAPTDGNLNNSNISFWLDESGNEFVVRAKYSTGALHTFTGALDGNTIAAAPTNSIQFNNSGVLGGISQMTFDGAVTLSMVTLIVQTHRNSTAAGYDAYVHSSGALGRGGAFNCYKSQGTQASPTAVLSGDALGYFTVNGYDGSVYAGLGNGGTDTGCYFQCTATENWSTTNHGSKWQFFATPNASIATVQAFEIGDLFASGSVVVRTRSPFYFQSLVAATSGVAQSSPLLTISGAYWTGAASATDSWTIQDVVANGTNGLSQLTFTHTGSTGTTAQPPMLKAPGINLNCGSGNYAVIINSGGSNNNNLFAFRSLNATADVWIMYLKSGTDLTYYDTADRISFVAGGDLKVWTGNLNLNAGKVSVYKGLGTVSGGVPAEYATIDLTAQGAAINSTLLYAVPASGGGMYRISWVFTVTQPATISSVLGGTNGFQITYTDLDTSVVKTMPGTIVAGVDTNSTNSTSTGTISGCYVIYAKASTNINYQMDYTSSGVTPMQFNGHVKCEAM